jgi:hypothetical protein
VIPLKQLSHKASTMNRKRWICIVLGLVAVPALHIYYVQEMIAALIIFSFSFGAVSIAALIIFTLVRTTKPIMAWVTPKVRPAMHRGVDTL